MGFLNKYKKDRAEKKAYRSIVKQKTTLAARQAYADEAVKVAAERARQKARRPSLFAVAAERAREGTRKIVSGERRPVARTVARRRYAPVKRRVAARTTRRVARRRYAPVKRRAVARRTVARRTIRKEAAPTGPITLDQAIYG